MMYLCQFSRNLAIGSENIVQTKFLLEFYTPGNIGYMVKVIKIYSFMKVLRMMYLCHLVKICPLNQKKSVEQAFH